MCPESLPTFFPIGSPSRSIRSSRRSLVPARVAGATELQRLGDREPGCSCATNPTGGRMSLPG
jgi:hypothetical protein